MTKQEWLKYGETNQFVPREHVVQIIDSGNDWFLEHSLRCRLAGLAKCKIHKRLASDWIWIGNRRGRYRVVLTAGEPDFSWAPR